MHVVTSVFLLAVRERGQVLLANDRRYIVLRDFLDQLSLSRVRCMPPLADNSWDCSQNFSVQKCCVAFVVDVCVYKKKR